MDKTKLLDRLAADQEERVALARVLDQLERCASRSIPTHTHFLTPALRGAAEELVAAAGHPPHRFFGGYEGAERTVCVFLPPWQEEDDWPLSEEDVPLAALEASFRPGEDLTHRDILGGLMGIGLTRERVGDILMGEGRAQIVALPDSAPIILSQFSQAGRCRLTLRPIPLGELTPPPAQVKEVRDTVATLRLDAVASSGFSMSRGKMGELISAGRVSLNHRACTKGDKAVAEGDTITCRGLGKCVLKAVGGQSRKGRVAIVLERYL